MSVQDMRAELKLLRQEHPDFKPVSKMKKADISSLENGVFNCATLMICLNMRMKRLREVIGIKILTSILTIDTNCG